MILEAKGITHNFNGRKVILKNQSLYVENNQYVCIVGKSGCGKSTLLNIVAGMLAPTTGAVYLDKVDMYKSLKESKRTTFRNSKIGYLNYGNCLLENLNVFDNIVYPVLLKKALCDKNEILNLLEKLDILGIKNLYPGQISAGEYRRVCFARILALNTEILVLDEPTSNLDEKSAYIIWKIISELQSSKGIIVATHDKMLMTGNIIELESVFF